MSPSRAALLLAGSLIAGAAAVGAAACLPSYAFEGGDAATGGDSSPSAEGAVDGGADGSLLDAPSSTDADATASGDAAVDGPLTPTYVGMGGSASCARMPDGTVQCWGTNHFADLGAGEPPDAFAYVPQPVPGVAQVTALGVGTTHACAVAAGVVECWGYGPDGELGAGTSVQDTPAPIQSLEYEDGGSIGLVAAGPAHTCGIGVDGVTLWCWGNYAGIGAGDTSTTPVYLATLDAGAVEMSAGADMTCERDVNGAVWCWGENTQGALGQGAALPTSSVSLTPLRVPLATPAAQIAVGGSHVCVVTTAHDIVCWGDAAEGELGTIAVPDGGSYVPSPTLLSYGAGHVTQVGCGDNHTCALFDDGGVGCWGYNYDGELGIAAPPNGETYPTSVPNLGAATAIYVHFESACAKLAAGGIACWGNDSSGQLGAGMLPAMPVGAYPVTFP